MHLHAQKALVVPLHQPQKACQVPVRQLRQGAEEEVKIAVQEAANKPFFSVYQSKKVAQGDLFQYANFLSESYFAKLTARVSRITVIFT